MRRMLLFAPLLAATTSPLAAQSFDIVRVSEGVFAAIPKAGVPVGSNGAFLVNEDHVLVVDTHYRPSYARELLGEIKKVTPLPVRYVVNTHWHNDHTQGNQAYINAWPGGVEFLSHANAREDILAKAIPSIRNDIEALPKQIADLEAKAAAATGADADRLKATAADRKAYLAELKQIEITLPTLTFDRSAVLHKKAREIQLLYFGRGHTRGDTFVYLPREKVVVGGDMLTAGVPFARDAYPAEWADTLAQVARLDIQKIIPGHGGVKDGKKLVEDRVGFLRDLVAQVKKGWSEGKDAKAIQAGLDVAKWEPTFDLPAGGAPLKERLTLFVERALAEAKGELR
jgi:glyoxylase-like metal-dependent hydrolase (beta-lactamase superfamily II)